MRATAPRRSASPLRPLLLLLPLVLTLAAHATVGAGTGGERPMGGPPPPAWVPLKRHDAESRDDHHQRPSADHEVPAGNHQNDEGDQGTPDEMELDLQNFIQASLVGGHHLERRLAESAVGLRRSLRLARSLSDGRDTPDKHAAPNCKGEDICLKDETGNRTKRSLNQSDDRNEFYDLLNEGSVNMDELSKMFCGTGSIQIFSASLKMDSTDLTGILKLRIQCVPTDFTRSHKNSHGKSNFSRSENRNSTSMMDVVMTCVPKGESRGDGILCLPADNKNASNSDFDEPHEKASKCDVRKNLPEVVKGVKCRYDLVEGAVNDIGKLKVGSQNICKFVGDRLSCSDARSKANKDQDTSEIVRYCKPLGPTEKECPQGYDLDTGTMVCVDLDECEKDNGGCGHFCENTNGGFRCKCSPGFFLMEDQKSCDNWDECAVGENGLTYAGCAYQCVNQALGYMCCCPDGYRLDWRDEKSCINYRDNKVITEKGVYYSLPILPANEGKCPEGFKLNGDDVICRDINECKMNITGCRQVCKNMYGGYECRCRDGFLIMKDGKSCSDFDECVYWSGSKCHHKCVNTEGSFRCECLPGFRLRADRSSCVDIDECRENIAGCSQSCENTVGSYKCSCGRGFYLLDDDKTCKDIDECLLDTSGCEQECENTPGSFRCQCRPGYALTEDQKTCKDVDECRSNTSNCTQLCENTVGSYRCKCEPGYFLMEDGKSCDDDDECARDENGRRTAMCSHICTNLPNGFMCSCRPGYRPDINLPHQCVPHEKNGTIICSQSCSEGDDSS